MMLRKNDIHRCTITGYTHDGFGVARVGGCAVFIPGAARGDVLDVRILKVLKTRAYGKTEHLVEPSPDRVAPDCAVFPACGGCNYRHISYAAECAVKREQIAAAFRNIAGTALSDFDFIPAEATEGYRNKAVYPLARGTDGKTIYGFYRAGSHRLVPCGQCRIHPPLFDALAAALCALLDEYGIAPYDEGSGSGVVRSLYFRADADARAVMVCVNAVRRRLPHSDAIWDRLCARFPQIASVYLLYHPKVTNRVLGEPALCRGEPALRDTLMGLRLSLYPETFYQINHAQAERLYERVLAYAALSPALDTASVWDLYCGAGSLTCLLARRCRHAVGIDIVPAAIDSAAHTARENGVSNASFFCADADAFSALPAFAADPPGLIVLDPPRKGLSPAVCARLAAVRTPVLLYVSCDPATMARDCAILFAAGYRLDRVTGVDLFPRTANVETVARFVL